MKISFVWENDPPQSPSIRRYRAWWASALLATFLVSGHAQAESICGNEIDPIWQEADGLRSDLVGDTFASAFGTFVKDLDDNKAGLQLWLADAREFDVTICLPFEKDNETLKSRVAIFISKGCAGSHSPDLHPWCVTEHAWMTSEEARLNAKLANDVTPGIDRRNNSGQDLITKERLAVERAKEMLHLKRVLQSIPDEAFKRWVSGNVEFNRIADPQTPPLGVVPGRLNVRGSFLRLSPERQKDVLTFELGKLLWFGKISTEHNMARGLRGQEVEALLRRHDRTIRAMAFRLGDLPLADWSDPQSRFAYACRVALLKLEPPATPPAGYSRQEWARINTDWLQTRDAFTVFISTILRD